MNNSKILILSVLAMFCFLSFAKADEPSPDWKDTLKWLGTYYKYDKNSPNYDWPNSTNPKYVNGFIYSIDGTAFPVLKGAYDIDINSGTCMTFHPYPSTCFQYYVKFSSKSKAKKIFDELKQLCKSNYGVDIYNLNWKQYDSIFEITGDAENIKEIVISVPGKFSGKTPIFPAADYFKISYSLKGTTHFYFSRNHLRVVDNKVALSDGTIVPIISSNDEIVYPIQNVEVNNMQGENEVYLHYIYTVTDGQEYDNEFVKLYSFYAKHFGFPVTKYKIWDVSSEGFIINYENSSIEIRIQASGQPTDKTGLHSNWQKEQGWTYLWVEIFFKGKTQIIPGQ